MKAEGTDASPMKTVVGDLESLRLALRESVSHYLSRMEGEIDSLQNVVNYMLETNKVDSGKMRDIRDMLTVLRHVDVKPEKGRRKDIKKIESVLADLKIITEHWK